MKYIIYDPKTELHKMFIESLCFELQKNKYETLVINNLKNNTTLYNFDYNNDKILIILNPHFLKDCLIVKSELIFISLNFKLKILYLTEPINLLIEKKVYEEFIKTLKPFQLWTYTYENFNKLNTYLKIYRVPPLYNNIFIILFTKNKNYTNKIIFFGNINENRQNIINNYFPHNSKSNSILNITNTWTKSDWKEILDNNLFYLNIHRRPNCKSFESLRIIPILSNGGIILSSRCNEKEEEEFKEYNIYFLDENELYFKYNSLLENINYEEIYQKTVSFRNKKYDLSQIF